MITELCIDVINTFTALKASLDIACYAIAIEDKNLPGWFQAPKSMNLPSHLSAREQACALLQQLEYLDQQQPREILVGAGLFAASSKTIESLNALNVAKNNFKRAVLNLKAAKIATQNDYLTATFEQVLSQRNPELATTLSRMGMARVHLKQCYRRVPYFLTRPTKVAWTWANTRSIKKIDVQTARELLQKQIVDAGIEHQLRLLQGLDANEKLAIVQELAPHLRANIVFPDADGSKRLMVKGPIPIFYLFDEEMPLPEFTPPGEKKGKNKDRMTRKDVKINPEPFLPAIRAYRYFKQTTN